MNIENEKKFRTKNKLNTVEFIMETRFQLQKGFNP
jgi:hypothetical protein